MDRRFVLFPMERTKAGNRIEKPKRRDAIGYYPYGAANNTFL